jgi:hypothetical protein
MGFAFRDCPYVSTVTITPERPSSLKLFVDDIERIYEVNLKAGRVDGSLIACDVA